MTESRDRTLLFWLVALWAGVGCMVVIGGVTRLTGSGLSITDWRPVTGFLPPLTPEAWSDEYGHYMSSPQGRMVNGWMALADFQQIYFWEWAHRLAGRSLALLVAIPWAIFALSGRLRGRTAWAVFGVFLLGAAQGLMGWLMVRSGLVDQPHVDHLRLAAHLILALILTLAILKLVFGQLKRPDFGDRTLHRVGAALVIGVLIQCALGAFVAGTRAGLIYSTWPGFGGPWPPPEAVAMTPWWRNVIENPAGMHVLHRTFAWCVAGGVAIWAGLAWNAGQRRLPLLLLALVLTQIALGIATVLLHVPIATAVAHQACAWLLLSTLAAATWATHPRAAPWP